MNNEGYTTTIGLEVHAELKTNTKMFCNSKNDTEEKRPNANVCPICMGHPGTLPVINKEAVKHVLKVGLAIGGTIADFTEFDRKNYFYPDIPKGYQISQYKYPLVSGGELHGVKITRIHLEEDTAKSTHDQGKTSLIDFNRAGLPLMELVTEPVVRSAEQASTFAKELQLLLRYLGVAEANMEKGEMRVEANISVSKTENFGTKTEVKNLNSFKVVEKAIAYEVKRQIALLENGESVVQETRGWDEVGQKTFSQRAKENAHDYRYFPDPDLPKLRLSEISDFAQDALKNEMGELPWEKRIRLKNTYGLKDEDVEIFVQVPEYGKYFEDVVSACKNNSKCAKLAANYILSDYSGLLKKEHVARPIETIKAGDFAELISMIDEGKLSSRTAKDILVIMFQDGGKASEIAEIRGLIQKSDEGELKIMLEKIVADNPKVVADYKAGKQASLQFFIGQAMKATRGSGNPEVLRKIILELLA